MATDDKTVGRNTAGVDAQEPLTNYDTALGALATAASTKRTGLRHDLEAYSAALTEFKHALRAARGAR